MKSRLSTGVSILISIVLVAVGLVVGAVRGFSAERQDVIGLFQGENGLISVLMARGADGLNLRTVAQRHIPDAQELRELETVSRALAGSEGTLAMKQELNEQLDGCVSAVLPLLESADSYLASQRDQRYVVLLKNDLTSLSDRAQNSRCFEEANAFNQKLESNLMGKLAVLLGVKPCTPDSIECTNVSIPMPTKQEVLTDEVNALSSETSSDILDYAEMVQNETGIRLHVALVHFTNGMEVRNYAEKLFKHWELGDGDLLIVGAVGEDSFAVKMKEDVEHRLSASSVDNLLYTSTDFSQQFDAQQYDHAFGSLFRGMTALLNKQYRQDMELGDLFAHTLSPSQQAPSGFDAFGLVNTLGSIVNPESLSDDGKKNGMGVMEWVLLIGLLLIIVNGSDPVRKAKRRRRNR